MLVLYCVHRIPQWDYVKFAESFGAKAFSVSNAGELHDALVDAGNDDSAAYLIQVVMPRKGDGQQISCNLPKLKVSKRRLIKHLAQKAASLVKMSILHQNGLSGNTEK